MNRNDPILMSDPLKSQETVLTETVTFFLISFESYKSDDFNCTSIEIDTTSVPFHLQFSLSSLRERRGKLLYFSASE